jgi:hypothetical protein
VVFPEHRGTQGPRGTRLTADVHGSVPKQLIVSGAMRSHAKCMYRPPGMRSTLCGTSHKGGGWGMVFPEHRGTQGPRGTRLTADVHGSVPKQLIVSGAMRSHAKCMYRPPGMRSTLCGTSH